MKLKPCPFCGKEAEYVENYMASCYVKCGGCGVKMYSYGFGRETIDCRDGWNTRNASVESLDADVRKLDSFSS